MSRENSIDTKGWERRRWERDSRYYETHMHQDLWGGWVLTRAWGRRETARGRIVHTPCNSYQEALRRLAAVASRRRRRRYGLVLGTVE
jgi:hypothetical protein